MPAADTSRMRVGSASSEGDLTSLLKGTKPAHHTSSTAQTSAENCTAIATTLQEVHKLRKYITVCCLAMLVRVCMFLGDIQGC